jgi:hypothetical protein
VAYPSQSSRLLVSSRQHRHQSEPGFSFSSSRFHLLPYTFEVSAYANAAVEERNERARSAQERDDPKSA